MKKQIKQKINDVSKMSKRNAIKCTESQGKLFWQKYCTTTPLKLWHSGLKSRKSKEKKQF